MIPRYKQNNPRFLLCFFLMRSPPPGCSAGSAESGKTWAVGTAISGDLRNVLGKKSMYNVSSGNLYNFVGQKIKSEFRLDY